MQLGIREAVHGGVPVVSLAGEVDLSTAPRLRGALQRAASGGSLVVDLDGVHALDDVGLGILVGAAGRARSGGGDLVLVCTDQRLLDLLRRTRLDRALDVFPSIPAAIAALTADRGPTGPGAPDLPPG
jgi:anti-sigma B factor antagonist